LSVAKLVSVAFVPKEKHRKEMTHPQTRQTCLELDGLPSITQVLFKANHIYRHNLLHINYMMYDVRHETDMINP